MACATNHDDAWVPKDPEGLEASASFEQRARLREVDESWQRRVASPAGSTLVPATCNSQLPVFDPPLWAPLGMMQLPHLCFMQKQENQSLGVHA